MRSKVQLLAVEPLDSSERRWIDLGPLEQEDDIPRRILYPASSETTRGCAIALRFLVWLNEPIASLPDSPGRVVPFTHASPNVLAAPFHFYASLQRVKIVRCDDELETMRLCLLEVLWTEQGPARSYTRQNVLAARRTI